VFAGTALNQTGQAIEIIAITMAVYLAISLLTSALMNWYNATPAGGALMAPPQPSYVRRALRPAAPPRRARARLPGCDARLFRGCSTRADAVSAAHRRALVWPTVKFMLIDAVWTGSSRVDCLPETLGREVGACWPFIKAKFAQFMYGFYPAAQAWRVDLTYAIGVVLLAPLLIPSIPWKGLNAVAFFVVYPVVGFVLLVGGVLGLEHVETRVWGGLLVTLVISFVGIVFLVAARRPPRARSAF
jgi:general L-amino acid transport system permease protein